MMQRPLQPKKAFSRIGLAIVAYTLAVYLFMAAAVFLVHIFLRPFETSPYYSWGLTALCQYVLAVPVFRLVLIGMPVYRYAGKRISAKDFCGAAGLLCVATSVGSWLGMLVTGILERVLGYELYDTIDSIADSGTNPVMIACLVLFAPVFEELLFRKWMVDRLCPYGEGLTVIFSGLVFGLFHGNFTQCFYAAGIGMVLAYVYLRTQRIGYTIALHMIFNVLFGVLPQLLTVYYPELGDQMPVTAQHPAAWLLMAVWLVIRGALVVYGLIYWAKNRRRLVLFANVYAIPKGKRASTVCGNVGMILLILVTVIVFATNLLMPLLKAA